MSQGNRSTRETAPDRGDVKCKGPEAGTSLGAFEDHREASEGERR